ncbi:FhaA domain-containing protein [Herbiconiux sp. YIM B11900]|uniref:FhaA domain-containing protein n=1 Tax=Herbiconiux sp. YIM B11900 TaxID=3404131 RepID=UPI003F84EAC3
MGILDNFEKGLERAVNGAFAKTFRSGLQPVEISSALKRELDTTAAVVSRDRILVPNSFRVLLAPADLQRMTGIGQALIDDLLQIVTQHAAQQGFQFAGAVSIELENDAKLTTGVVRIESSTVQGNVTWTPVLDVAGQRHPITKSRTVIGRGSDADITIDDSGTSRKHVEILWDGSHAQARDLGSTNGSQLNGQAFQRANLEPDSVILIGRTSIVFRVVPQTGARGSGPAGAGAGSASDGRPQADPGGFWR